MPRGQQHNPVIDLDEAERQGFRLRWVMRLITQHGLTIEECQQCFERAKAGGQHE